MHGDIRIWQLTLLLSAKSASLDGAVSTELNQSLVWIKCFFYKNINILGGKVCVTAACLFSRRSYVLDLASFSSLWWKVFTSWKSLEEHDRDLPLCISFLLEKGAPHLPCSLEGYVIRAETFSVLKDWERRRKKVKRFWPAWLPLCCSPWLRWYVDSDTQQGDTELGAEGCAGGQRGTSERSLKAGRMKRQETHEV